MNLDPNENVGIVSGILVFLGLYVVGSLLLGFTWNHRSDLKSQLRLFGWASRCVSPCRSSSMSGGLINVLKDEDGSGWLVGVAFNAAWVQEGNSILDIPRLFLTSFDSHHKGFYYLLGCLYFFVEPARLPAAALNGLFGSLTVVYTYRIGYTLFSPLVAGESASGSASSRP